jgi:peroxin-19
MESVVKDIISKDSMYEPMKKLKDAYPEWLEKNWENLKEEDLERYNQQLDKVTEICAAFEISESD